MLKRAGHYQTVRYVQDDLGRSHIPEAVSCDRAQIFKSTNISCLPSILGYGQIGFKIR